MRVLLLYDCCHPESLGGVEYRNHCLARALAARGHEVTIAGWMRDPAAPQDGVTMLKLAFRTAPHDALGKRHPMAALRLAAAASCLDVGPYDVIETANIPYLHILPLALRCALARKPLIVTWYEHFGPYWTRYAGPLTALAYRIVEAMCVRIGHVTALSDLTADRVRRARGRNDVAVIPGGVWLRDIRSVSAAPAPDAPKLLFAGRLITEKRVDLLLRAVAALPAELSAGKGVTLGIVGDGPERVMLEALAAELGIAAHVRFYGRLPEIAGMWRLLAGSRIAVQPSVREGFGLFPLEAMALGRPVVTCESDDTAVGGTVRDGIEGICAPATPAGLALALNRLLMDAALWQRMSEAAERRARDYDWTVIAERTEALFEAAIRRSPSARR